METAIRNRVPHIILLYWIIKIAATTLGETGADMFSMTLRLGYAETIAIFLALFLVLFAVKLGVRRYDRRAVYGSRSRGPQSSAPPSRTSSIARSIWGMRWAHSC